MYCMEGKGFEWRCQQVGAGGLQHHGKRILGQGSCGNCVLPPLMKNNCLMWDTWHQRLSFQYFQQKNIKSVTSNNMNIDLNKVLTFYFQHGPPQVRRRFFSYFLMGGRLCVQSTKCAGDRGVKIYNILYIIIYI